MNDKIFNISKFEFNILKSDCRVSQLLLLEYCALGDQMKSSYPHGFDAVKNGLRI